MLRVDRAKRLAAVTVLCVLVSLLNPNGIQGAILPLEQLGMIGPEAGRSAFGLEIREIQPITAAPPVQQGLLAVLAALSFAAMALNWRRARESDPLVWVAFAYLAVSAWRNVPLFAIVATPMLVRNLNELLDERALSPAFLRVGGALLSLVLVGLTVDASRDRFFPRLGIAREAGLGIQRNLYPIAAVEWIAERRPPGPICHNVADGGYLIWRLYPEYQVMVDGRLEVFGAERFQELMVRDAESFRAIDEKYRCGIYLLHYIFRDHADWPWLNDAKRWRLAFFDDVAAVYLRVSDAGAAR